MPTVSLAPGAGPHGFDVSDSTAKPGLALDTIARVFFNAYNDQGPNPWKTFDGRIVPPWDRLSDQVRAKWTAVATSARTMFELPTRDPEDTAPGRRQEGGDKAEGS